MNDLRSVTSRVANSAYYRVEAGVEATKWHKLVSDLADDVLQVVLTESVWGIEVFSKHAIDHEECEEQWERVATSCFLASFREEPGSIFSLPDRLFLDMLAIIRIRLALAVHILRCLGKDASGIVRLQATQIGKGRNLQLPEGLPDFRPIEELRDSRRHRH